MLTCLKILMIIIQFPGSQKLLMKIFKNKIKLKTIIKFNKFKKIHFKKLKKNSYTNK